MNEYLIVAAKQAVGVLAGALITYLLALLKAKKTELEKKDEIIDALVANDQAMLRQDIINTYYVWEKEGYMPPLCKASLEKCFERYHASGGNSFTEDIMNKVRKLPDAKQEL